MSYQLKSRSVMLPAPSRRKHIFSGEEKTMSVYFEKKNYKTTYGKQSTKSERLKTSRQLKGSYIDFRHQHYKIQIIK